MPNEVLQILLKPVGSRNLMELITIMKFYETCSAQEFKYAWGLEYKLRYGT